MLLLTSRGYGQQATEKEAVVNSLEAFHQAIVDNNTERARSLLADSAKILESGVIESRDEYLADHFHMDGKFLSAMNRKVKTRNVTIQGEIAWVSTNSRTRGTYKGRDLNLNSLELAVLTKVDDEWEISSLHWSSSKRK